MFYNFITKYTEFFCWKNERSFSHFLNKKYWHIWDISVWNFNESLTNDIVSFKQLGPGIYSQRRNTLMFYAIHCNFLHKFERRLSCIAGACVEKRIVFENDSYIMTFCRNDNVSALDRMKIHWAVKKWWSIFLHVLSEYTFKMSRDSPPWIII